MSDRPLFQNTDQQEAAYASDGTQKEALEEGVDRGVLDDAPIGVPGAAAGGMSDAGAAGLTGGPQGGLSNMPAPGVVPRHNAAPGGTGTRDGEVR